MRADTVASSRQPLPPAAGEQVGRHAGVGEPRLAQRLADAALPFVIVEPVIGRDRLRDDLLGRPARLEDGSLRDVPDPDPLAPGTGPRVRCLETDAGGPTVTGGRFLLRSTPSITSAAVEQDFPGAIADELAVLIVGMTDIGFGLLHGRHVQKHARLPEKSS